MEALYHEGKCLIKKISEKEIKFTFSRSSGVGGQNVNKVNSKVSLHWRIDESSTLPKSVRDRFKKKFGRFISNGVVSIHSQVHRTQKGNVEECKKKLNTMISQIYYAPKTRIKTKPGLKAIQKRIKEKKKRGEVKKLRREKF